MGQLVRFLLFGGGSFFLYFILGKFSDKTKARGRWRLWVGVSYEQLGEREKKDEISFCCLCQIVWCIESCEDEKRNCLGI